jgi:ClpP class serine protease
VQSALIASRIRALAQEFGVPVLAFCEDVAASGGYWLACAADEIYADENSIVGSIGVISMGFGFPDAIKKLGVERRVHTSGTNKSQLDPFQPEKAEDVARLEGLLADMHESFKAMVRLRRSGKLKADEETLFTGEFWRGAKARDLGLVDGLGHMTEVIRRKFGEKAVIKAISASQGWGLRRIGLAQASDMAEAILHSAEDRAWWSRFGL